jgi:hypothetical protein
MSKDLRTMRFDLELSVFAMSLSLLHPGFSTKAWPVLWPSSIYNSVGCGSVSTARDIRSLALEGIYTGGHAVCNPQGYHYLA